MGSAWIGRDPNCFYHNPSPRQYADADSVDTGNGNADAVIDAVNDANGIDEPDADTAGDAVADATGTGTGTDDHPTVRDRPCLDRTCGPKKIWQEGRLRRKREKLE